MTGGCWGAAVEVTGRLNPYVTTTTKLASRDVKP